MLHRADEVARGADEQTCVEVANLVGHLEVVGDHGQAEAQVLADLGCPHALIDGARIERNVEARRGVQRLVALQTTEHDDVVATVGALTDPLRRVADQPQLRVGNASVDLVPEVEEMVGVVQRAVAATVLSAQQRGRHVPDDGPGLPARSYRLNSQRRQGGT